MANKDTARKKAAELMSVHTDFDQYREQFAEQSIQNYKQYIGYKDPLPERFTDDEGNPLISNLHIPRTYQIVDTIRARVTNAFFKTYPYMESIPSTLSAGRESINHAKDKAKISTALINEQLRKNDIYKKYYDYTTSFLIFPLAIMGVGWKYKERNVKRKVKVPEVKYNSGMPVFTGNYTYQWVDGKDVVYDDNELINIDFFDFWVDPYAAELEDCRGVFHREYLTLTELKDTAEFLSQYNKGQFYPIDIDKLQTNMSVEQSGKERKYGEIGKSADIRNLFNDTESSHLADNQLVDVLHYWQRDRHYMIINEEQLMYEGPNPYWRHGQLPFITTSYEPLPNEMYGKSAVELISELQKEENMIHNQRADNINLVLNKVLAVKRGGDYDDSDFISYPGAIWEMDNPEDIAPIEFNDVTGSSFQQQNIVAQMAENSLGTPPIIRGAESRGTQTATESLKQTSNAGMRFEVKINLYKSMGLNRLFMQMDMNNQQFISDQRLIKYDIGDVTKWLTVNPADLSGEHDYRPATPQTDPAANKEVRREQLSMMIQMLMQMQVPYIDYYKLISEWLQSFDIPNPEEYILEEDKYKRMMALQQQQQEEGKKETTGNNSKQPSKSEQKGNAQTGRSRGRRPQKERNPQERKGGNVR